MIEITSDTNGRTVIPLIVRKALGIRGPASWSVEVQSTAVVLKPKHHSQGVWRRKNNTSVLTGVGEVDPVAAVVSLRDECSFLPPPPHAGDWPRSARRRFAPIGFRARPGQVGEEQLVILVRTADHLPSVAAIDHVRHAEAQGASGS